MSLSSTKVIRRLSPQPLTATAFQPYGQVIQATEDGKEFDQEDAQLVLDRGTPRFYIMQLPAQGLSFTHITYHSQCTQCLGSLQGHPWYIAVAPPCPQLDPDQIVAFRIPGDQSIKLELGTWHAGPLFQHPDSIGFYNLELSDTNITDHTSVNLLRTHNLEFCILA